MLVEDIVNGRMAGMIPPEVLSQDLRVCYTDEGVEDRSSLYIKSSLSNHSNK